jgi:hypothetical protein
MSDEFVWFMRESRKYMAHLPAWRFYPQALFGAWPKFRRLRKADRKLAGEQP